MSWTFTILDGDLVRDRATGRYDTITGSDKISQDVQMVLSTDVRSSGIGSGLDSAVGKDASDPVSAYLPAPVMFQFQLLVRNGLERLRRMQRSNQFSQRDAAELIYDFSPISIAKDPTDPRTVIWSVQIITVDKRSSFALEGIVRT